MENPIAPMADIEHIFSLVKNSNDLIAIHLKPGAIIDPQLSSDDSIYLVEGGRVSIQHKQNAKLLYNFSHKFIFGLTSLCDGVNIDGHFLSCEDDIIVTLIKRERFEVLLGEGMHWKSIAIILSYYLSLTAQWRAENDQCVDNYSIMRSCLKKIWAMQENERSETSIYEYISKRHHISRSSITKILKVLNDGNYIVTKRGVLLHIDKLPRNY